eukprot:scaffold11428_cov157-Amphora_coffeaeformis.AAC.4
MNGGGSVGSCKKIEADRRGGCQIPSSLYQIRLSRLIFLGPLPLVACLLWIGATPPSSLTA